MSSKEKQYEYLLGLAVEHHCPPGKDDKEYETCGGRDQCQLCWEAWMEEANAAWWDEEEDKSLEEDD